MALVDPLRVVEAVPELLPVTLGDAPRDKLGVIVADIVLLTDAVELGVSEDVPEPVGVEVDVSVTLEVPVGDADEESVVVDDVDAVLVGVAVLDADAP